jgi:hypothetical protein
MSILSGGRKRQRRRTITHRLWLAVAGIAGFVAAAYVASRL